MKTIKPAPLPKQNSPQWLWQESSDTAEPTAPRSVDELIEAYKPQLEPKTSGIGAAARGAVQGLSLGFADEITGALESAFTKKTYTQARDESRAAYKEAKDEHPLAFGVGELGGGLATLLVPGLNAAKGAKLATQAGKAALQGAISGAGASEADDLGGVVSDAAGGAALGAGLQGAIGGLAGRYIDSSVRRAATNTTKDLAEGAIPTFQRRFASMKDLAFKELEPDRAFMAAAKRAPEQARDIAEAKARQFGGQTTPIYDKLDKEVGRVPLASIVGHIDSKIAEASKDYGDSGALSSALEEVKDGLIAKAGANKSEDLSHKEVRKWVTGLLKTSFKKMGTISETENAWLAAEAHEVADDFLKGHLQKVGQTVPELSGDLERLTGLNKKIKAYASAEQLMAHKEGRAFWKQDGLSAIADGKVNKIAGIGAAATALATGNPMALGLMAAPAAVSAGAQAVKALDRRASAYLARLIMDAKAGNATAQQAAEAIRAGVPQVLVNQALGGYRMAQGE
jgi:hypothetical protein